MQVTLNKLSRLYLCIFVYTYKRVTTINGGKVHEFEKEQEEYERDYGMKREGEIYVAITLKQKKCL